MSEVSIPCRAKRNPCIIKKFNPTLPAICVNGLSYAAFFGAVMFAVNKELQEKSDGLNMLLVSIVALIFLFGGTFYASFLKCKHRFEEPQSDILCLLRGSVSVCYTCYLLLKNEMLPDAWNYVPAVVMVALTLVYLMQADTPCDRSYMYLWLMSNMVVQLYVSCYTTNFLTGMASFVMCLGQNMYESDHWQEMEAHVWFNYLAAVYCATAHGKVENFQISQ